SDLGVDDAQAGGVEDAPTPIERAMALEVLPLVGREAELTALVDALRAGGVVVVAGPPGAGRTRLICEAAGKVQAACASTGRGAPTCARSDAVPPSDLPS